MSIDCTALARAIKANTEENTLNELLTSGISGYNQYKTDPIGFGENILHDQYTDDVKTLIQSVKDYPITIAKSANATGKTHAAARIAIWYYKTYQDAQVYTAAAPPEENLKKLLWGEIGSIVHRYPELFSDDTVTNLNIMRHAQSYITGVTIPSSGTPAQREAKFSGKHAPHLLFIIDEGDAVPDEVYRGIESCMSGGDARLLVLFNPREQIGPSTGWRGTGGPMWLVYQPSIIPMSGQAKISFLGQWIERKPLRELIFGLVP